MVRVSAGTARLESASPVPVDGLINRNSQLLTPVVVPPVSGAEHERIKARLREVEQERDILKKALGIFSRGI